MIRFIIGRAGSGKSTLVRDEVCRIMRESDECAVVIVPEQQTVLWETRMAGLLPESANLRLEITNFTRLSNSVFREYGGLSSTPIDEGTRTLLVWRAMAEIMPTLATCGVGGGGREKSKLSRLEKCVPRMMKAVEELKSSGLSPKETEEVLDALIRESEGESTSGLSARLSDAVLVYSAYTSLLGERGIDRFDVTQKLARTLRDHPYFAKKHVFIDSFFSLTGAEESILLEIMRQAESVSMTFTCPTCQSGDIRFRETADFLARAKSFASRAGREYMTVELTENRRHSEKPALAAVEEYLFDYERELPDKKLCDGSVRVIKCADRYDEAECAAAIIGRLVHEGASYGDIAITAADMSSREGVIDSVLRRHGIRCFMSERAEVSTSPLVRLITSALRVEDGGWARDDIIKMIKTGLTPLSRSTDRALSYEDVFETYTGTWNIRGRALYTADAWSMNPEGYKMKLTPTSSEILTLVNEAKDMLIPPLVSLLSVFDGGVASVREIAERIVYFTEDYGVYGSILSLAESYSRIGMLSEAKKTVGMHRAVMGILDKMVEVLGDMNLDAGTFAGLFRRVAATLDVGSIPTGIDEVVLGSASGLRVDSVRHMIILGSVDGEFPASISQGGDYFDDTDRVRLEGVGLSIQSPDTEKCTAREHFMYYRSVATPTESLYVLAPVGDGSDLSEGAQRILDITGAEAESFSSLPLSEVVHTPAAALYQLARRTDEAEIRLLDSLVSREGDEVPLSAGRGSIDIGIPVSVGGKMRMSLSESRIESFAKCPLSYSCKYILKLSPSAKAEISTPDVGTFMHSVLEEFFSGLSAEDMENLPLPADRVEKIADATIRDYVSRLSLSSGGDGVNLDGRLTYLFVRLKRHVLVFLDAIMRELVRCEFRPVRFELGIGIGDNPIDPTVFTFKDGEDTVEVTLRGIADRVDVCNKDGRSYIRIVDYKTGSKTFSIEDVYRGIGVQLLIYLFSLWEVGIPGVTDGEIIPAVATYLSLKPKTVSAAGIVSAEEARELSANSAEESGILLSDDGVLSVIDPDVAKKVSGATVNEKGRVRGLPDTYIIKSDELSALRDNVARVVCEIAMKMKHGVADADPTQIGGRSPCEYCDAKYLCRPGEG